MKGGRAARAWGLLWLSCLTPLLTGATPPPPRPPHSVYWPARVRQWKDRLSAANEDLLAAKWKQGYAVADVVLREMRDSIASGDASAQLLAVALFLRSVGAGGQGRVEDAAWDFCAAQALYPAYAGVDLRPYGEAVAGLDAWRYVDGAPPTSVTPTPDPLSPGGQVVMPPRRVSGNPPKYPRAKAKSCIEHPVAIKSVIDELGRPQCPFVPPDTDPVLAVAALDAVHTWRFRPATLAGKPVRVAFLLSIDFQVKRCY